MIGWMVVQSSAISWEYRWPQGWSAREVTNLTAIRTPPSHNVRSAAYTNVSAGHATWPGQTFPNILNTKQMINIIIWLGAFLCPNPTHTIDNHGSCSLVHFAASSQNDEEDTGGETGGHHPPSTPPPPPPPPPGSGN